MAVKEEAVTARPEPKEAGEPHQETKMEVKTEVKGVRTEVPDTRTGLPVTPAGSIGSMGSLRGFVQTDTTAPGETTRAQDQGTTETSSPAPT